MSSEERIQDIRSALTDNRGGHRDYWIASARDLLADRDQLIKRIAAYREMHKIQDHDTGRGLASCIKDEWGDSRCELCKAVDDARATANTGERK